MDTLVNVFLRREDYVAQQENNPEKSTSTGKRTKMETKKSRAEYALPRVQEMNPHTNVSTIRKKDIASFSDYALVILIEDFKSGEEITSVESKCVASSVPFFTTSSFGMYGVVFLNLGKTYHYKTTREVAVSSSTSKASSNEVVDLDNPPSATSTTAEGKNASTTVSITEEKQQSYCSFSESFCLNADAKLLYFKPKMKKLPEVYYAICFRLYCSEKRIAMNDQTLAEFKKAKQAQDSVLLSSTNEGLILEIAQSLARQNSLPPVNTILGGLIGQEVIKVISGKDAPADNAIFFNGVDGSATIRKLQ